MDILLIIKNEFKKNMRNKVKWFLELIVPALVIVIAIGINTFMKEKINIGVVNNNTESEIAFMEKSNEIEGVNASFTKRDEMNSDMILGKYAFIVEFNEDNSYKVSCLDKVSEEKFNLLLNNYVNTGELSGFNNMLHLMREGSMSNFQRSIGLILLTFMILSTITFCGLLKDKEEGVLRRISCSRMKPWKYILGTYLYSILKGMISIGVSLMAISMLSIGIEGGLWKVSIVLLIVVFISSSFGVGIVAITNSELRASTLASSIAVILGLLGGAFLPIEKMPDLLKLSSNGSVFKWIIELAGELEKNVVSINVTAMVIICALSVITLMFSAILGKRKFV